MSKRIFRFVLLIVGFLGLIGCIAAIIGTWSVSAQVNRASERIFGAVDDSLAVVERRVAQTKDRIQALKITTEGIEEDAKNWTKKETREVVSFRLGVGQKAERLASGLDQAGHWLELTESSIQLVKQSLEVGTSLGVPVQADPVDRLLEELASLRTQLTDAIESVERIRERAAEVGEDGPREESSHQTVQLAVRVIAILASIDARLETLGDRLNEVQTETRSAKSIATWWIRNAAIGISLLLGWMAVGQGSLFCLGWKGCCRK